MAMYTELVLNVALRKDTPEDVIAVVKHMVDGDITQDPPALPCHPVFDTHRWLLLFRCSSYYFVPFSSAKFRKEFNGKWYLSSRSDLKNYDGEIEKFVDWIMPYIDAFDGEFLGYSRYEEDRKPNLLWKTS